MIDLKPLVRDEEKSIVIARHGLEWWTAWALGTKVGQEKAIDEKFSEKYEEAFFIIQVDDQGSRDVRTPLSDPTVPKGAELLYSSEVFEVFRVLY